jgi:hypothetical protein
LTGDIAGNEIMKNRDFKIAVVALITSLLGAGCAKKPPPAAKESPPPFQRDEQSLAGMVKQERTKIQNDFTNLKYYYSLCANDNGGRGPANWEQLKVWIGNDLPSLTKGIEDGRYVVIYKSPMGSNDLIAYEKQADTRGQHVALFGDGHIVTISKDDLVRAKKEKN